MITKSFNKDGIPTVSTKTVEELKDITLIDVRMPDEYTGELGHILGSRLITLGPDLDNFLNVTDKQLPIIFICRSSARSGKATAQALSLGFKSVYNMEGGMLEWNSLAFPITK